MRFIAWTFAVWSFLAFTATAVWWDPNARHAEYADYKFDSLTPDILQEMEQADVVYQKCTANAIDRHRGAPLTLMQALIKRATTLCQREKDARIRDLAYEVEQRKRQAQREQIRGQPRGGGGYTAEERAKREQAWEEYDACIAQSQLMAKFEREDAGYDRPDIKKNNLNRQLVCTQVRRERLQEITIASRKRREAEAAEKQRRKKPKAKGNHLEPPDAMAFQNDIKGKVESIKKAGVEFLQKEGIQEGLSNLFKNPIPKGVKVMTPPAGLKLGPVPVPLRA
ncbi:MAG: transcription factor TFIIIC subunit tfc4 [Watsoniomyces obsoletus]|nr:MAG: transcription factor TFIIIC subunit tfc4 [Watsoniomyces obsoletus]